MTFIEAQVEALAGTLHKRSKEELESVLPECNEKWRQHLGRLSANEQRYILDAVLRAIEAKDEDARYAESIAIGKCGLKWAKIAGWAGIIAALLGLATLGMQIFQGAPKNVATHELKGQQQNTQSQLPMQPQPAQLSTATIFEPTKPTNTSLPQASSSLSTTNSQLKKVP